MVNRLEGGHFARAGSYREPAHARSDSCRQAGTQPDNSTRDRGVALTHTMRRTGLSQHTLEAVLHRSYCRWYRTETVLGASLEPRVVITT